ncbi:Fatty acyl-CoA hydrolase precursor, medium chain [Symbiodinium microadriaticum]|uniref:Carboxylic ester hydrolase n=1 Tax=Symbiodinium microadriaticum TaxID=2951 RepID=A0A1Q9DE14_SYMMI|nr:Fatty acyl-CoA hydrolase precursor, medium chain [Symbiodinium microadriaticum]
MVQGLIIVAAPSMPRRRLRLFLVFRMPCLPPIGVRRWQPPVGIGTSPGRRSDCWKGQLDASKPGPACLQGSHFSHGVQSSEDCLRLHVHTKNLEALANISDPISSTRAKLKPVLVWLHGGGLLEGSPFSLQSGYGAQANLTSENDVVLVSVQYRLGVAGFLSLASLSHHDVRGTSGNYGLLDCLEALRWIQGNIRAFGGDPEQVTVWGQSSGGSLVLALLASPAARGLFHRGISMSGSPKLNSTTVEAANYWHREVVERSRCAEIGFRKRREKELLDCLLHLSAGELLQAQPDNWHADVWSLEIFSPTWQYAPLLLVDGDGGILPRGYLQAFQDSKHGAVPAILGVTREESDFAPGQDVRRFTRSQLMQLLARYAGRSQEPAFVEELGRLYGLTGNLSSDWEPQRTYAEILSDMTTICPNLYLAGVMDAHRPRRASPVFSYVASRHLSRPFCVIANFTEMKPLYCPRFAFHAMDEFAMLQPHFLYNFTEEDRAWGQRLRAKILEFVATGKVQAWQRFSTSTNRSQDEGHVNKSRELLSEYNVIDFGVEDENTQCYNVARCNFWLQSGFYDSRGLVNLAATSFSITV